LRHFVAGLANLFYAPNRVYSAATIMKALFFSLSLICLTIQCSYCFAADPVVERALDEAKKKYPPGDYPVPAATVRSAADAHDSATAQVDENTRGLLDTLMNAIIADDYDAFASVCDAPMRAAMTREKLDRVNSQVAPRASQGYDVQYLGDLFQRGYKVYLWKLRFKDGGDDLLATMAVKDEEVGGFYLN
jgi:hypothetical protein